MTRTDNLPTVSPDGRTLAYFAMARPTYEADRQVLMLRDLASGTRAAADPELGTARSTRSPGRPTAEPAGHRRRHARRARVPRRCRDRRGHAPDRRRPLRQRPRARRRRRARDDEQHHGARRPLPHRRRAASVTKLTDVNRELLAPARPGHVPEVQLQGRQQRHGLGLDAEAGDEPHRCRSPSSSTAGRRAASPTAGPTAGTRACSPRPAMPRSASISTARPVTARPSPTRSTRTGAAGRSRTCRRASPTPPRTTRSSRPTTPARSAAPTAAT